MLTSPESLLTFAGIRSYGAGIVRVAIGDDWESGGKNRSALGETLFFLSDATLEADGKVLVRDGRLVDR